MNEALAGLPQFGAEVSCCGGTPPPGEYIKVSMGSVSTQVGEIPKVATQLTWADTWGRWKARWNIGRMKYTVAPGLYAVGAPTVESPVFVSANYKMSFDYLRAHLRGRDGWIMVLDTRGINVWCAAGKGTFGTDEIVRRIAQTRLSEVVSHRKLILPQLGAPGVAAHEVKDLTGFRVVYGPVRAADLPAFLDAGNKATEAMRLVRFGAIDRLVLTPVEMVMAGKYLLWAALALFVLSGLGGDFFSFQRMLEVGGPTLLFLAIAYAAGGLLTPLLLPWLPGRSFSLKGGLVGLVLSTVGLYGASSMAWPVTTWDIVAWLLLATATASFIAMNFTGASTYTSLSGVRREMRVAVPLQIAGGVVGLAVWITARFV